MNKKFSTLVASLLFTSAFSAGAQVVGPSYGVTGSETAYRTQLTQADMFEHAPVAVTAETSATFNDYRVHEIKEGEWYQLQVPSITSSTKEAVLVQLRDYKTGELYLKAVDQNALMFGTNLGVEGENPSLNSSLWRIKVNYTTEGSYFYEFVNKETGFTLSYNCAKATEVGKNEIDSDFKLTVATATESDINMTDIAKWRWYTGNKTVADNGFDWMRLYTYTHTDNKTGKFEKVLGLAYDKDGSGKVVSVITDQSIATGTEDWATGHVSDGFNILPLIVRRAGVRVLRADDINRMIDADGSWMNAADKAGRDSVYFKNADGLKHEMFSKQNLKKELINGYKAFENLADAEIKAGAHGRYEGYNIFFAKQYPSAKGLYNKYLMVATDRYEDIPATDLHRGLVVKDEVYRFYNGTEVCDYTDVWEAYGDQRDYMTNHLQGLTDIDALSARYLWKVTYYPTQDSLAFEPLNASVMATQDKLNGKKTWEETVLIKAPIGEFYNTVNVGVAYSSISVPYSNGVAKDADIPVALSVMNRGGKFDSDAVLTVGISQATTPTTFVGAPVNKYGKPVVTNYISEHGLKVQFDHNYTYMKRASLENGLYFIQVSVDKSKYNVYRKDGSNLVMNLAGRMMYDKQDDFQDYRHMPATQWVIEQDTCHRGEGAAPYVTITNREYGAKDNHAFRGQLYELNGKYYFINHSDIYQNAADRGRFEPNKKDDQYHFSCGDTLVITPVDKEVWDKAYLGYKHFDAEKLPYETYSIKYNKADVFGNLNTGKYLHINEDGLLVVEETSTPEQMFEFTTGYQTKFGGPVVMETEYGYKGKVEGLAQLKRTAYVMKVRDNNLIDNEWNYVVAKDDNNGNLYYQNDHLKNVNGSAVQLAAFYFKADQVTKETGDTAYVPVQLLDFEDMQRPVKGWLGFAPDSEYGFTRHKEYANYHADRVVRLENAADAKVGYMGRKYYQNGFMQLGIKSQTTKSTLVDLDTYPETVNDAFVFTFGERPLYMTLAEKNIKMFRTRGEKEYLFEDGHNQSKVAASAMTNNSYLGLTGGSIQPMHGGSTAFYALPILASSPRMPKYLFFVNNNAVEAGRWCKTGVHGYYASPEASAEEFQNSHDVYYNAYQAGRLLVNFNDSIFQSLDNIDMTTNAAKFGFKNYTRLGFVEAIYMNVTEEVIKNKDLTVNGDRAFSFIDKDMAGEYLLILKGKDGLTLKDLASKWGVLDPAKVKKAIEDKLIDVKVMDNMHQSYAFSLRYTGDNADDVLLESQGYTLNNKYEFVPNTGSIGTFKDAAWLQINNGIPVLSQRINFNGTHNEIGAFTSMSQLVNQAQVLNVETTTENATGNEDVTVSEVSVVATNGAVVVKGAAGKTVAISNILGQTIANTVIASDNETISVPAGIVVVVVEGEEAVKAVVR